MTIQVEGNKLSPDTYIELLDFDYSNLSSGGDSGSVIYLTNTPTGGGVAPIAWRSNNYFPFPYELTNIETRGDGTAPNRPTISLANSNKFLLAAVISFGNLIGTTVRRWRTFYKYTDGQPEANTIMHYPIEEWVIIKKTGQSKNGLQFEMANALDRPGLRLPRRLILRDQGFPGVSKVRLR
jgi:lambda family phage minor tail protein L